MKIKVLKLYPIKKTNSSNGKYCINYDFQYESGLKANGMLFFFRKNEAINAYNSFDAMLGISNNLEMNINKDYGLPVSL